MGQPGHGIDANVGLHTEIPLVAFLGLLHLQVALLGFALGGPQGACAW